MAESMSTKTLAADASPTWQRYGAVAVFLHWAIALMILGLLASGLWMTDAIEDPEQRALATNVYQIHKSFGLSVLALTVLRIVWRLLHPTPEPPAGAPVLEVALSRLTHFGFYALMVAMPLTGWAMVSASDMAVPTFYFGLFEIPHIPALSALVEAERPLVEERFKSAHEIGAWIMIALLLAHIGAALKHHFVEGDAVLARMTPGLRPRRPVSEPPLPSVSFTPARVVGALAVVGLTAAGAYAVGLFDASRERGGAGGEASFEIPTASAAWMAVSEESVVGFAGEVDGAPFDGRFESWMAKIAFDPADLASSSVEVSMDVTTATIDDPFYDPAMRGENWFDAANHPEATFRSSSFAPAGGEGDYLATGVVAIRGVEQPVELPFSLTIDGDRAEAAATVTLDRLAFGIGAEPSPQAPEVSEAITVSIKVVANRVASE